jgi:hypothetical protein
MKKKGWKKPAAKSLICGNCKSCDKQLISDAGGWIVTHRREYFCHDGKEGSCFDNYCELKYKQQQQEKQNANGRKKEVSVHDFW